MILSSATWGYPVASVAEVLLEMYVCNRMSVCMYRMYVCNRIHSLGHPMVPCSTVCESMR